MEEYLKEVRAALIPHADKERGAFLQGYINTKYPVLGILTPQQRLISKKGFSFSALPQNELDKIWCHIWNHGKEFEVLSQSLMYYGYRKAQLGIKEWKFLKTWVKRVDNWAHSDSLSDVFATLHDANPPAIFPQFETWNKSSRPWEVRQSLVALFYYARARQKKPPFGRVMRMVKGAFSHPDVYVQKGIGWTLRECYNTYPELTWEFLVSRAATLSPVAWQAATEKLSLRQKNYLKYLRKQRV
jgi:3-methyladenine DNA glycosylase AlkD